MDTFEAVLTRAHLEAFLEVVDQRSIQAAANRTGRSRATYHRYLKELQSELGASELLERAPGQREGLLTPAGEELVRRSRAFLRHWDQWLAGTRDAVARGERTLRVGAVAGSFDLLVDVLDDLLGAFPGLPLHLTEFPGERLLEEVASGAVDLGIGTVPEEVLPRQLRFMELGHLDFALIAPKALAVRLGDPVEMAALEGLPMVMPRSGAARDRLDRHLADHPRGPLLFSTVAEVESSPRMVELVARGFGAAIVTRFRLAFVPPGVAVRALADGPPPIGAGVFVRRTARLGPEEQALIELARARFARLAPESVGTAKAPKPKRRRRGPRRSP